METPKCDSLKNLEDLRKDYEAKLRSLGEAGVVQRVKDVHNVTESDEKVCIAVANHYGAWTHSDLLAALSGRSWMEYQILDKYHRAATMVGSLVFNYNVVSGIRRMTQNSYEWIKRNRST